MKREYSTPEFDFCTIKFDAVMSEVVVSKPQIPDDDINLGLDD